MWLFHFLMKKSLSSTLRMLLASNHYNKKRVSHTWKITTFAAYPQVLSYLLRKYATDENIAYIKDEITMFIQAQNKNPVAARGGVDENYNPLWRRLRRTESQKRTLSRA